MTMEKTTRNEDVSPMALWIMVIFPASHLSFQEGNNISKAPYAFGEKFGPLRMSEPTNYSPQMVVPNGDFLPS